MQGCRKSDTFSPQAWRGDDGARRVKSPPARPLAAKVWDWPPGLLHVAAVSLSLARGGLIGAASWLRSL